MAKRLSTPDKANSNSKTGKYHEIGYLFYKTIGKMKSPKCISYHHAQTEENNFNELDKMCKDYDRYLRLKYINEMMLVECSNYVMTV